MRVASPTLLFIVALSLDIQEESPSRLHRAHHSVSTLTPSSPWPRTSTCPPVSQSFPPVSYNQYQVLCQQTSSTRYLVLIVFPAENGKDRRELDEPGNPAGTFALPFCLLQVMPPTFNIFRIQTVPMSYWSSERFAGGILAQLHRLFPCLSALRLLPRFLAWYL